MVKTRELPETDRLKIVQLHERRLSTRKVAANLEYLLAVGVIIALSTITKILHSVGIGGQETCNFGS
jgi:hypothetical protein